MRILKKHSGCIGEWPLPSGNRVRFIRKSKGRKSHVGKEFSRNPSPEDEKISEYLKDDKVMSKHAYISARLLARSGGHR